MTNNEQPFIDLKKLTPEGIIFSIFFFISVVSPGFLYFYLFHTSFFIATDWVKLLFLSGGITMPLLIINTFIQVVFSSLQKAEKISTSLNNLKLSFPAAAVSTASLFYISFGCLYFEHYLLGRDFISSKEIFVLVIAQTFVIIVFVIRALFYIKHSQKKPQSKD